MEDTKVQYLYTDEKENPLYRITRYYKDGEKSFYAERFENNQWIKNLKDVNRVLYQLPLVVKAAKHCEKIYIVEGEKDVDTLIKKGKIATTIAGGAKQKWLDSYTEYLKNCDVIILPDNDKSGKEFATKVADSLLGNANTIKLLDLTKAWPELKEKGDITDVFEMVKDDEVVLKKLEELEEKTTLYIKIEKKKKKEQQIFEVEELGLKLKIPKGYAVSKEGGVKTVAYDEEGNLVLKSLFPILIFIKKILKNIDTGEEKAEIVFLKRNKWESIIVNKNILYNSQNIVGLANKGLLITSNIAKVMINWFYQLEITNLNELKVELNTNKMGWVDNTTFIPFRCNEVNLELEPGINTWLDNINKKHGTIEEWIANIKEFIKEDETGIIRFMLAVGFSSCLLHIVNYRGTIYHLWGNSGIGKTGLLELVNSIYAPPSNIITFAATPISITILSERLSGIGLIIDEKQSSFDDSKIAMLLYSLAEGRTRMKATKESDLVVNKTFEINVITSGEEPLNERSHTGASRRTIEIYLDRIFKDDKASVRAHEISKKCYGFAGEIFVNKLIDDFSNNEYKEIKEKYEKIQTEIQTRLEKEAVNSYVQSISVIVLADILMNRTFNFGFDEEDSIELGLNILEKLNVEKEIDEVERAKEIIENWLIMNDGKFDRQCYTNEYDYINDVNKKKEILEKESKSVESFGLYQKGIYYLFPMKFNELMRENNLSPNKIRRGFAERGYIKIDEINNRFTVTKFYKGGNRRMLAYKLENESKRIETEIKGDKELSEEEELIYGSLPKYSFEKDIIGSNSIEENEIEKLCREIKKMEERGE